MSPNSIYKYFSRLHGLENIHAYGVTPLTSLEKIVSECAIMPEDVVYELGCGTGRSCFWLSCMVGCRVVGIEQVPRFMEIANGIQQRYGPSNVTFLRQDMLDVDYQQASVIYLYGSALTDELLARLCWKFKRLKPGSKIITVSYSIEKWFPDGEVRLIKKFPIVYPWGKADVFLQEIDA